jgi:ubiquinone/menaquinone biosynthesis C-methylase UbiE
LVFPQGEIAVKSQYNTLINKGLPKISKRPKQVKNRHPNALQLDRKIDKDYLLAMNFNIKKQVQKGYSRAWVVDKYAVVGLWPSEDELFQKFWPYGTRVLDLGCGAGRTTLPIAQQDYWVTGADISFPMVQRARDQAERWRLPITWATLDATDLPFANETFGAVLFSYNGIELVPDGKLGKQRVLSEVWRVLKPGGHFIFTTHAIEAMNQYTFLRFSRLLSFLVSKTLRRPTLEKEIGEVVNDPNRNLEVYYMQIISPRTYRKMLANTGFEVVYYNSRQRIDQQKPPSWIADIDPDFKFYVARKPIAPSICDP